MGKIEIKLKDCCLTCEHFDPRGVIGFGMCPTSEREITCGHMAVCEKYNNEKPTKWAIVMRRGTEMWACGKCGKDVGLSVENKPFNFCPHCGTRNVYHH